MEVNRLKPMIENYDVNVFNDLYKRTENLRKKLTSEINPHRFGLQSEDIFSWFDIKFIHIFNKYYNTHTEDVLFGHLLKGLQYFKMRILRSAYTKKFSQKITQVEDPGVLSDLFIEEDSLPASYYMDKLEVFMRSYLSDDSFYLMQLQLNPPPYILHKLNSGEDSKKLDKITDELILDYFDIPYNKKTQKYISGLREEIKKGVLAAKEHFKHSAI